MIQIKINLIIRRTVALKNERIAYLSASFDCERVSEWNSHPSHQVVIHREWVRGLLRGTERSRRLYTLKWRRGKGRCWNEEETEEEQRTGRLFSVTPDSVCCPGSNTALLFTAKESEIERETDHELSFLSPISPVTRFLSGSSIVLPLSRGGKGGDLNSHTHKHKQ